MSAQEEIQIGPNLGTDTADITASLCPLRGLGADMFGAIAALATTTAEFATDGAEAPAQ